PSGDRLPTGHRGEGGRKIKAPGRTALAGHRTGAVLHGSGCGEGSPTSAPSSLDRTVPRRLEGWTSGESARPSRPRGSSVNAAVVGFPSNPGTTTTSVRAGPIGVKSSARENATTPLAGAFPRARADVNRIQASAHSSRYSGPPLILN